MDVGKERERMLEEMCSAAGKRAAFAVTSLEDALPRCV
jgi:hypothetical protein